jgi:hypothetical protein
MGAPWRDNDVRVAVRRVTEAAISSTKRNFDLTRSIHGVQNADLNNAPEIEFRPLWR